CRRHTSGGVLVNHPEETEFARQVGVALLGADASRRPVIRLMSRLTSPPKNVHKKPQAGTNPGLRLFCAGQTPG
ncbi:hypothetical protein, partial [Klebsiella pneumoniae]|uniref:hypothetical protein n=1 Tax=Klebsiella pneumoniae TaxID=573 RepID=UPI00272F2999